MRVTRVRKDVLRIGAIGASMDGDLGGLSPPQNTNSRRQRITVNGYVKSFSAENRLAS